MCLNIVRAGRHKKAGRIIRLTADQWAHLDRVRAATGRPVIESKSPNWCGGKWTARPQPLS
jgi:hypothetical protein